MIRVVFDTNVLVSVFLTRHHPGGASTELRRFVETGAVTLFLSPAIIDETAATLIRSKRMQSRYHYTPALAMQYCGDLFLVATIIINPPPVPGSVKRDPGDDKIIACALAARADYLVTRDDDLLSMRAFGGIVIITPEDLLPLLRQGITRPQRP